MRVAVLAVVLGCVGCADESAEGEGEGEHQASWTCLTTWSCHRLVDNAYTPYEITTPACEFTEDEVRETGCEAAECPNVESVVSCSVHCQRDDEDTGYCS